MKKSAITRFLLGGLRRSGTARIAAFLVLFALGFAGCDLLRDLGVIPEDSEAPKPKDNPPPVYIAKGEPVEGAAEMNSIKAKFGVTLSGKEGVSAAFKELSAYIKTNEFADPVDNVIKLGDYIDLEGGLTVEAYPGEDNNGGGDFSYSAGSNYTQLIVVGINSFHSGRGTFPDGDGQIPNGTTQNGQTGGQHTIEANDATPHVVFQFRHIPVEHRMNPDNTNEGGYRDSEMRQYLLQKFLPGLKNAGVPKDALWAPKRYVSAKESVSEIEDALWLPTEREICQNGKDTGGNGPYSDTTHETAENQAWLEYYSNNASRAKRFDDDTNTAKWYWIASPHAGTSSFCHINGTASASNHNAGDVGGCAPAFCIK